MAELKWTMGDAGHYETSSSIHSCSWKVWVRDGTVWYEDWEDNAAEIFRFNAIRSTNLPLGKQLAQRIEDVLDPPECPELRRTGDHWREVADANYDAIEFNFCPDCGTRLEDTND